MQDRSPSVRDDKQKFDTEVYVLSESRNALLKGRPIIAVSCEHWHRPQQSPPANKLRQMLRRPSLVKSLLLSVLGLAAFACSDAERVSVAERAAIADSLESLVKSAYDFSKPDVVPRLLALYPDSGRVISASAGHVSATRTALATEIAGFWQRVGQNMQNPRFIIGSSYVDVITRNAAIMTFSYSIPHTTPLGLPHTVSGAWTTLWRRQGGRWMIVQEHLSDTPESTASSVEAAARAAANPMAGHVMPPAPKPDSAKSHKHF